VLQSFVGGRFFGRATGSAPARVLALHGWGRTHRDFDAVLAPAAAGPADGGAGGAGPGETPDELDAIAVDLPGFGATPPPPEAWGTADYAAAVADVLDEMAPPVVVLGHSFGGLVAVQLAAARPEAVRGLVLTGAPLRTSDDAPRRPAARFRLARALNRAGLLSDARMEEARRRHGSADYRAAEGVMRQVLVKRLGERYDGALAGVGCPVSLVWGDDDTAAPLAMAHAAATRLAHAELTVEPGAGHLTPLTVPATLRRAVVERLG